MMTVVFGTVLPWVLLGTGTWLGYQLVRQNGRILLRLDSIEQQLGQRAAPQRREPGGLPTGAPAPEFELPDLAGARRKLSEFRGRDALLIFFNPKCGFCTKMAADLAALPIDGGGGRAVPIVVTTTANSGAGSKPPSATSATTSCASTSSGFLAMCVSSTSCARIFAVAAAVATKSPSNLGKNTARGTPPT